MLQIPEMPVPRQTVNQAAINADTIDALNRPYMPRRMTLLNTTRVQGKPARDTSNTTLGMYTVRNRELAELDAFAHSRDHGWLHKPRLIKAPKS